MNEMAKIAIKGEDHWTSKDGGVKLFLFEKCAGDPAKSIGTILFVHGSSMASQPTFDLQVPGRPELVGDGSLRAARLRLLVRRHGGLWPLDQGSRQQCSDFAGRRRLLRRGTLYPETARQAAVPGLRNFIGRTARSNVRRATPGLVARLALDAMVWTGEGSPTLEQRRKKLPEFQSKNRRPIDKAFIHSIFDRDHPGTAEEKVINAFADAVTALDTSVPTGTYVDMCSRLPVVNPERITVPTLIMRGQWDGIASIEDLLNFYAKLPNPDKQFTVMPGISHASFQQKNYMLVYHILASFFAQPAPIYRG